MSYENPSIHQNAVQKKLENAFDYIAEMVALADNGAVYVPIFERLEAELAAITARESAVERARRVIRERAMRTPL